MKFNALLAMLVWSSSLFAQNAPESLSEDALFAQMMQRADSINQSLIYQTGLIKLEDFATINVPEGFKYLDARQSRLVLEDLWGNPEDATVLGMLFPEYGGPLKDSSYAFAITFDDMGYVKDNDAADMDYEELLKDMLADEKEINKARQEMGYGSIHMVGWAQKPFYDNKQKVLHWAKELQFQDNETNTLNYDVRVLGRRGVLSLNAIAEMDNLDLVKKDVPNVLQMAAFTEGNRYEDYNDNTDKVAAYTVGGLVAGKLLAKAGFFTVILKFWKLILLGLVGAGAGIKKFFFGKKETPTEELAAAEEADEIGKVNEG